MLTLHLLVPSAFLGEKTGQRTVPNIFINGKHVSIFFSHRCLALDR